ncbi:hypothetical protein GE09DRAFT_1181094 [Coniochaeta sp. 2T2.1]|nr:hypothetical protein GE09DRAFT_1181094 [Coniochaeta sp. 2T2.1]
MTSSQHQTFTPFPRLPPELRIQIWTYALTLPTVYTATLTQPLAVHEGGPLPQHRSIRLTCISSPTSGPPPPLSVSLTCREARHTMKHLYKRPLRGPILDSPAVGGGWWIYLENAVVVLPDPQDALAVLDRLGSEVSRFKHVALAWEGWRTHPRVALRLANSCRELRTMIVQRMEEVEAEGDKEVVYVSSTGTVSRSWLWGGGTRRARVLDVDGEMAEYYAELAAREVREGEREGGWEDYDAWVYRRSILQYFGEAQTVPRLYALAPDEATRRGRIAEGLVGDVKALTPPMNTR